VPVVMLTGSADHTKVREAQRLGAVGYLLKPIQPEALVLRLKEILARCQKAAPLPPLPKNILTVQKHDRVLLVESELPFLEFALSQLSAHCHVELATSAARALQVCVDAPPAAIFLGGPEDFAANALFVAQVRNHKDLSAVPIFALVPAERIELAHAQVGFDAVLPRTLDQEIWTASARLVIRRAPNTAIYLANALDATRECLASRVSTEVATLSGLNTHWLQRWLSARIDFDGPDAAWSLTLIACDASAGRIAKADPTAGAGPFTEALSVSALTSLALEAFEAIRGEGVRCLDTTPHCEIRTCTGAPPVADGVVSAEKWVLALQFEILVLVRLSERQTVADGQAPRAA
jgi:DNA-binding response OmpR family regulator